MPRRVVSTSGSSGTCFSPLSPLCPPSFQILCESPPAKRALEKSGFKSPSEHQAAPQKSLGAGKKNPGNAGVFKLLCIYLILPSL